MEKNQIVVILLVVAILFSVASMMIGLFVDTSGGFPGKILVKGSNTAVAGDTGNGGKISLSITTPEGAR